MGATRASVSSKLDRILGDAVPPARPKPSTKGLARGSAGEVVARPAGRQTDQLHNRTSDCGPAARIGPQAPHRRAPTPIRAQDVQAPVRAPGSADAVSEELRWLGQTLGEARDAQVLRERLRLLVASEPPELVLGPVLNRIEDELCTAYRSGLEQALRAAGQRTVLPAPGRPGPAGGVHATETPGRRSRQEGPPAAAQTRRQTSASCSRTNRASRGPRPA